MNKVCLILISIFVYTCSTKQLSRARSPRLPLETRRQCGLESSRCQQPLLEHNGRRAIARIGLLQCDQSSTAALKDEICLCLLRTRKVNVLRSLLSGIPGSPHGSHPGVQAAAAAILCRRGFPCCSIRAGNRKPDGRFRLRTIQLVIDASSSHKSEWSSVLSHQNLGGIG
jgi:hypothetical protein